MLPARLTADLCLIEIEHNDILPPQRVLQKPPHPPEVDDDLLVHCVKGTFEKHVRQKLMVFCPGFTLFYKNKNVFKGVPKNN